jgi:hypothetical protein
LKGVVAFVANVFKEVGWHENVKEGDHPEDTGV